MCGRYALTHDAASVAQAFAVEGIAPYPPRYNIAPTQPILAITGGPAGEPGARPADRRARLVRWGLIPGWAKDPASLPLLFNARCETAATKASFRAAMRYRRCLIPASGFYEWRKPASGKGRAQPFHMRPDEDHAPFAFAGLWETWIGSNGEEIDTGAILTTGANARLSQIHPRMPVVVEPADHARWLDTRDAGPADVADILVAGPDARFTPVAISDAINRAGQDGATVQAPTTERADEGGHESARPNDDEAQLSLL